MLSGAKKKKKVGGNMIKKVFNRLLQKKVNDKSIKEHQISLSGIELSGDLSENVNNLKTVFDGFSDIVYRDFHTFHSEKGILIFLDGLVNTQLIDSDVLKPLMKTMKYQANLQKSHLNDILDLLKSQVISVSQVNKVRIMEEIVDHILSGETILLIDGIKDALIISLKEWDKRSIDEPATETVVRGPREGFTENLRTNTTLIRRRLKTHKLKMEAIRVGRLSKTDIVITYLEGIADESMVGEVRERINRIDIDAILESAYIEELIQDHPFSIFPQVASTERPDKLVASLLEGQVGIIIDNTPFALIAPQTFFQMLQSSEDYYQHFFVASLIRCLRFLFVLIALLLPSLYIAITTFHQEMIPTTLLLSMASARETVPFPALIEALIMEISFEGLREAGVRLPRPIGQAVSIVGALVIGEAAVQAGIVSTPMVIVVSITGIASFIIPSFNQATSIRMLRFPLMIMAGTLGLYGILLSTLVIQTHISTIRSFGVPYFSPVAPLNLDSLKDTLVRAPRWAMNKRPGFLHNGDRQRIKDRSRPRP